MNGKHKIDDLFRKALSDYREELPSVNTEGQIFRKLSYKKYFRLLKTNLNIFAIAIPIALLAYFLLMKNSNNTNFKNNIAKENKAVVTYKGTSDNALENNYEQKSIDYKTTEHSKSTFDQKTKNIDAVIIKTHAQLPESVKSEMNDVLQQKHTNNIIEKNVSKINNNTNDNNKNTSILSELQVEKTEKNDPQNMQLPVDQTAVVINEHPNLNDISSSENTEIVLSQEIKPTLGEANIPLKAVDSSFVQQNEENLIKKGRTKSYHSFAIELSGNFYYVTKKLSADNEFANLVKTRNEAESAIITFLPGIELKLNTKNFFLQTGISYQVLGEKVQYDFTNVSTSINTVLSSKDSLVYIPDPIHPPGHWEYDSIWSSKPDTSYLVFHRAVNQKNMFKYFEIPLLLGKSFAFHQFVLDVSTGISLGILLKADAQILSTDNLTFIGIDDKQSPYMKDLTINYLLRIAFRYQINEKWSVFARPSLKINLGSVFNENQYPVQQKYTLYGIGLGVMYKF